MQAIWEMQRKRESYLENQLEWADNMFLHVLLCDEVLMVHPVNVYYECK